MKLGTYSLAALAVIIAHVQETCTLDRVYPY